MSLKAANPTPEQIAAAKAILAQAETPAPPEDKTTAPAATEQTHTVAELRTAFEAAMASPVYLDNPKKLVRLMQALVIPLSNDMDLHQFLIHSRRDLKAAAAELAFKNGTIPVLPTEEQIIAEAKRRQAIKLKKEADKAASKAKTTTK